MLLVDKLNDAQQFFLDINDGVQLEDYEVFKAELFHHAKKLDKNLEFNFKEFALKFENQWLNFFDKFYDENSIKEEYLVLFIKYCFRMMWIEENYNSDRDESEDIEWIDTKHLNKLSSILDYIINIDFKKEEVTILNNESKIRGQRYGQHWNLDTNNYNEMIKKLLENIAITKYREEINKDVIVWCYISNISKYKSDELKKVLYKYLRIIKKILNNNREVNERAYFDFYINDIKNGIEYSRYSVRDIPKYYHKYNKYEESYITNGYDENTFLYDIINLNSRIKGIISNESDILYILETSNVYSNNEEFNKVIKKEYNKLKSSDKNLIEKYENLPFINGLVENLRSKDSNLEDIFVLDKKYKDGFYEEIEGFKANSIDECYNNRQNYVYKEIIKFGIEKKINWSNHTYKCIMINWNNYSDKEVFDEGLEVSLLPHTWCDLFTSEKGIEYKDKIEFNDFIYLIDGYIDGENNLTKPGITTVDTKKGFSANKKNRKDVNDPREVKIGDIGKFIDSFECIQCDKEGHPKNKIPDCLKGSEGWVKETLRKEKRKIYFGISKDEKFYKRDGIKINNKKIKERLEKLLIDILKIKYREGIEYKEKKYEKIEDLICEYNQELCSDELYGYSFFIKLKDLK